MILRIGDRQRIAYSGKRVGIKKNLSAKRCSLHAKKGLTLIEVMMAVFVLSIGIVGVLRAYASSVATLEMGQYHIDAVSLLKQKMGDVQIMALEKGKEMPSGESGDFEGKFSDFLWAWEIRPTETDALNELELVVSHSYNPRTFSLKTYVVDPLEEEKE